MCLEVCSLWCGTVGGWKADMRAGDETRESADFHAEIERKLKMDW